MILDESAEPLVSEMYETPSWETDQERVVMIRDVIHSVTDSDSYENMWFTHVEFESAPDGAEDDSFLLYRDHPFEVHPGEVYVVIPHSVYDDSFKIVE